MPERKSTEKSFNEFLKKVEAHIESFNCSPQVPFYRGANKSIYKLIPSLFRNSEKIKDQLPVSFLENNLYYDFCAYGAGIIERDDDWDVLFKMQHHGIPTRLLDWSESFGVALYFALSFSSEIDEPCIWVLDPFLLNDSEKNKKRFTKIKDSTLYNPARDFTISYYESFVTGNESIEHKIFDLPQALYPIKSNERIRSQWGIFTVHGKNEKCISEQLPQAVKKFIIPDEAIPAAKLFLKRAGINHFSMFPDLQGLKSLLDSEYYDK